MPFKVKTRYSNIPDLVESMKGIEIISEDYSNDFYTYTLQGDDVSYELAAKLYLQRFIELVKKLNKLLELECE